MSNSIQSHSRSVWKKLPETFWPQESGSITRIKISQLVNKMGSHCLFPVVDKSGTSCYHLVRGSWRGGRIPISQPKFWLNPIVPEHKSHYLSGCPAELLIPFPFSIVFLLMNPSPSAWNPIFPPKNKQIPVPILPLQDPLVTRLMRPPARNKLFQQVWYRLHVTSC